MQNHRNASDASGTAVGHFLSAVWWPLLYFGALLGAGMAFASDAPLFWFNIVYATLFLAIVALERLMPHREIGCRHPEV
jgi:hypothetical protein